MRIVYFHNEHDKASRDLLTQCQAFYPNLEVIPFMQGRSEYWFRGTPAIWVGCDQAEECLWRKEVDVTFQDFQDALDTYFELVIVGPEAATVNTPCEYSVACINAFGNAKPLPIDLSISLGEQIIADSTFELTFTDPGTYAILVTGTNCAKIYKEVVVVA